MKSYRILRHALHISVVGILLHTNVSLAQSKVTRAFTVSEKDLIPEGIAYDPASQTFFLSSIFKNKIVMVDKNGKASDFAPSGHEGLRQVLGMKVDSEGQLWACNNSAEDDSLHREANIHVFDIRSKKLVRKITIKDGTKHLFNDIYIAGNGDAYATDSDGAGVWLIKKGEQNPTVFIPCGTIPYPNGITATSDEKKVIVSTGGGQGIVSIDRETKAISPIAHAHYLLIGNDGLYRYKKKLIGVQNVTYPQAILEMQLNATETAVESIRTLAAELPELDIPTTGVVVGDEFYFIANSQLFQLIGNHGQIKDRQKLNDTVIMKIKLN